MVQKKMFNLLPSKPDAKRRGITLVELLVAMTMGILIITAGYSIYVMAIKSYRTNTASAELTQNARIALERTSREIRQNVEILSVLPEDPSQGTPSSSIKFQDGHNFWPAPGEVAPAGKIQYIEYYLDGTNLKRKVTHFTFSNPCNTASPDTWVLWSTRGGDNQPAPECTDLDQVKAESVTTLQFWGNKTITINLTVSDGIASYQFETKSLGRNIL